MNEQAIFVAAAARSTPAERAAYLDSACAGTPMLRRRVEALLRAHEQSGDLLDLLDEALGPTIADSATGFDSGPSSARSLTEGPGSCIGPYRLTRMVGEGGMGAVFLAEQEHPVRRTVALKVIKPGMDSAQVVARLEAERQALALMDHPNIARFLDAGTTGEVAGRASRVAGREDNETFSSSTCYAPPATTSGRPYFVMEAVDGVPITDYCDRNRLTPKVRLELFVLVCQAIQHAHQKGIIHRDVKPSNVLVTLVDGRPTPKVIDFGIAKAIDQRLTEKTLFTQFGVIVGTPEYMSPEQAHLSGLEIDTRSDIYSLGVLLYELLTGTTPLDRRRVRDAAFTEVLRRIREEEPPKPSTRLATTEQTASIAVSRGTEPARLARLIRGDLDWIVMKALEKDPARRYETADGLARDVARYLNGDPVEAGPPSASYRLWKFATKHHALLATAGAFVALLMAATAISSWQAVRATRAERHAVDEAGHAVAAEAAAREERNHALAAEGEAVAQRNAAVKAKKEAEQQATIARAVNDFLRNDLLAEASPEKNARNKKVTVEELLSRAAAKISGRFEHQPEVEAAVRLTIGEALQELGLSAEASPHLERAVEIRRRVLGPEHHDTIVAQYKLGGLYVFLGRYREAETLLRQTVDAARRALGSEHPDTCSALSSLAFAYRHLRRDADSEMLLRETVETGRRVYGPEAHQVLDFQHELAQSLYNQGKYAEAEAILRRVVEVKRRVEGVEHPSTLTSQATLAQACQMQGKYAEAETLLVQMIEIDERVRGPEHPEVIVAQHSLAAIYRDQGKLAQAEALLRQVTARSERALGADHPDTLSAVLWLARVCRDEGKLAESEALFQQVLTAQQKVLGPDNPDVASTLVDLAITRLKRNRSAETEPLLRQALTIREKSAPDRWLTFQTCSLLGASLLNQKKYGEAERLLLQGYEGMKVREAQIPPMAKKRPVEAAERIVKLYEAWGKPEKAAEWRKRLNQPAATRPNP
jgi:serine/threonine protein kinase/tetratricopeptide (TPR) repeat protein